MTKFIAAGFIAILLAAPAHAENPIGTGGMVGFYMSGENLTKYCRAFLETAQHGNMGTPKEVAEAAYCKGFVLGVVDATALANAILTAHHQDALVALICIPSDTKKDILAEIVGNYLNQNPAKRDSTGVNLVRQALFEAYPCKQ
jgi:hypothetical protein